MPPRQRRWDEVVTASAPGRGCDHAAGGQRPSSPLHDLGAAVDCQVRGGGPRPRGHRGMARPLHGVANATETPVYLRIHPLQTAHRRRAGPPRAEGR